MIVGLDISTSCVGICALNDDGTFCSIYHVDLKKEKNFYKKVDQVIDFLTYDANLPMHNVRFCVEEPLKMFRSNASMAQTISLLQRFNAACCFAIYSTWRAEPKLINVLSARKAVGIKVPKKANTKQFVWQFVRDMGVIPESAWAYKKTGRPKEFCYDKADAYIVAYAGVKNEKENH